MFHFFLMLCMLLEAVGSGCADSFILHPWRDALNAGRAQRRLIRADGSEVIEAWVSRPAGANREPLAYVVEFTGSGTRAEQIADYVADRWKPRAVEVWAINYPGFGGSSGAARMKSIPPAALRAFDEVSRNARGKPIFVCGNSLGAAPALYVASCRDVAGLILQNPPPLKTIVLNEGWWNLWLLAAPVSRQIPTELEATVTAPLVKAPAVFVTSDCDTLVLPRFQQLIINVYGGPIRRLYLKNKGHNHAIDTPAELSELQADIDWLWRQTFNRMPR